MKNYLLALVAVALLALAGCSGANQEVTTEVPTEETGQTVKETPKLTGVAAEVQSLMAAKAKIEHQITYDVLVRTAGGEMKSTMIQYFDGANRMRTDVTVKGMSEMRTYVIDGTATTCSKVNSKWTCNSAEAPMDETTKAQERIAEGTSNYAITNDGTKQLLGKTHNCYKLVDGANAATMRYCFSADGVPVYISSEMSGASTEMTALLYGKDVAETVWVIPT
jgi:FtsP/CotA-like multicopper oxidase with cupredoxin domain